MPTCSKLTAKKYKGRPSPPYSAQACKGRVLKGNDGKMYVSRPDKRGIHKWTLQKPATLKVKGKEYEIIDNGNRSFIAVVSPSKVSVFTTKQTKETPIKYEQDEIILSTPYLKIFIGDNDLKDKHYAPKGDHPGNSILIKQTANKYIYVGDKIYSFYLFNDKITKYFSPLGNNQVPYPYALGEKYAYFMLDKMTIPMSEIDPKKDGYGQFYGFEEKSKELTKKPFEVTMIKQRQI